MYIQKFSLRLAMTLLGMLMATTTDAKDTVRPASKAECISIWTDIVSPAKGLTADQQQELWEKEKPRCEQTGSFDYFMGKIHLQAGEFEKARAAAKRATKFPDDALRVDAELLIADTYFYDLTRHENATDEQWREVGARYEQIVKKYPSSYAGYDGLAGIALARKDYVGTISLCRLANEKSPTARAYRKLSIAYMQVDQYEESVRAGMKAAEIDPKLAADRDMVLAIALSNIELGYYDSARANLNALLSYNPQLKNDSGLVKLVRYLRQKTK